MDQEARQGWLQTVWFICSLQDITRNRITDDADAADRITASYEKARYSDKNISKEELEFMLDFIKNDKYNKRT